MANQLDSRLHPKDPLVQGPAHANIVLSHPRTFWEPRTLLYLPHPRRRLIILSLSTCLPTPATHTHPEGRSGPGLGPRPSFASVSERGPLQSIFARTVLNPVPSLSQPGQLLMLQISAFLTAQTGPPTPPRLSETLTNSEHLAWLKFYIG